MQIEVGQEIFVRGDYRHQKGETVKITKVGNKYFYINSDTRFEKNTLRHDNGKYSPSIWIWESQEIYQNHVDTGRMWDKIRESVNNNYKPPKGLSIDRMEQAYGLLFGDECQLLEGESEND